MKVALVPTKPTANMLMVAAREFNHICSHREIECAYTAMLAAAPAPALSPPAEEGATPRVDALREGIRHRNILRGFNMPEDHHDALELAADFEAATNTLRARVLELERELSQSWNAAIESALELVLRSKQNMICRTVTVIGDKNYEAERCVAVTKTKADEEFRLLHQAIRALLR